MGKWGIGSWGDPGKRGELPEEGAWKEPIFLAHPAGIPVPWCFRLSHLSGLGLRWQLRW